MTRKKDFQVCKASIHCELGLIHGSFKMYILVRTKPLFFLSSAPRNFHQVTKTTPPPNLLLLLAAAAAPARLW